MTLHECPGSILTTTGGRALISSRLSKCSHLGRAHSTVAGVSGNVEAVELRGRRIRCGSAWARIAGAGSLSAKFRCGVMESGGGFDLSANGG
jgi:hypothetical protein